MWERVYFGSLTTVSIDSTKARKGVLAVNVHCARSANTLTTRAAESQRRVDFVLNLDEGIEDLASRTCACIVGESAFKGKERTDGNCTIGPVWFKSMLKDCRVGLTAGSSGF